ncbi:6235_t:CDS:1, partial [Cetraspora pellucida]
KKKEIFTNLKPNTESYLQHNTSVLTKYTFDNSYQKYPKKDN